MIDVTALEVRLGRARRPVLAGVDLQLRRGEMMGLLGPPEAGKTVLLKALAGLVRSSAGTIACDGVPVAAATDAWRARLGFAFQNDALFDGLSVADNVAFPLRQRGMPDVDAQVAAMLAEVDLGAAAGHAIEVLSGGMRKRVGIARAAVTRPEVGLFDEPLAGLDPQTGGRIMRLLARLTRQLRMAAVVVSHDLDVLLPACSRVVMLVGGRVAYDGLPAGLRHSPRAEVVQFVTGSDSGPL